MTKVKQTWHLLHICCPGNYRVNAVFTNFALLANVLQTQNLTDVQILSKYSKHGIWFIFATHANPSFGAANILTSLHNYCRSKSVSNVYFLFKFATLHKYRVNAVFTIFAFHANVVQT